MERSQKPEQGPGWWETARAPEASEPPAPEFPLPGWPDQPTVEYLTKLILLGLLLLSLPYLIGNLIVRPVETLAAARAPAIAI